MSTDVQVALKEEFWTQFREWVKKNGNDSLLPPKKMENIKPEGTEFSRKINSFCGLIARSGNNLNWFKVQLFVEDDVPSKDKFYALKQREHEIFKEMRESIKDVKHSISWKAGSPKERMLNVNLKFDIDGTNKENWPIINAHLKRLLECFYKSFDKEGIYSIQGC